MTTVPPIARLFNLCREYNIVKPEELTPAEIENTIEQGCLNEDDKDFLKDALTQKGSTLPIKIDRGESCY